MRGAGRPPAKIVLTIATNTVKYRVEALFLFLIVGGILTVGGQFALSLGVHPDRVAIRFADGTVPVNGSLVPVLQGCLGSVLAVTGMLGLAEGYQREAGRLGKLLNTKLPIYSNPESDDDGPEATRESIAVASSGDLGRYNRYFCHAYLQRVRPRSAFSRPVPWR